MRSVAYLAVALLLFALAHALEPALVAPPVVPGHPLAAALGPLRPVVAELVRLRFESSRVAQRVFGQLDDAWTVLALASERADEFSTYGSYFTIDAPILVEDAGERGTLVRAGFEIFEWGRRLHPSDWRIECAEAFALDHLLRQPAELRAAAGAADDDATRDRLLDRCSGLLAKAPAADDPLRAQVLWWVGGWLQSMLARNDLGAALRARTKELVGRLLSEGDVPEKTRAALEEAMR